MCKDSGAAASQLPPTKSNKSTFMLYGDDFDADTRMIRSTIEIVGETCNF